MAHAGDQLPVSQLGCGSTGQDVRARARDRLIQRDEPLQVVPPAAEVPDLYGRAGTDFPLEVEEILFDVGCVAVVFIAQYLRCGDAYLRRHLNAARVRGTAVVGLCERQRCTLRRNAPLDIAAHIKNGVGRILRVENAVSGSDGRFQRRAPYHADAWRKVRLVGFDQPIAQAAVARDADRRIEPGRNAFVRVAATDPDEAGFALLGRRSETRRDPDIHHFALHVSPGRGVFVTEAEIEGNGRTYPPCILNEVRLAGGP